MRNLLPVTAVLLAISTAAAAKDRPQRPSAAPLRIVIPIVEPKCETPPPIDGVIVVCGRRDERYRIDPTVLAAIRSRDSRGGPRPDARDSHVRPGMQRHRAVTLRGPEYRSGQQHRRSSRRRRWSRS